ncbi:MAG: hypothetical protein V3T08_07400 [Gemmatimonadota bacterium]|jgi:hypothetical protein
MARRTFAAALASAAVMSVIVIAGIALAQGAPITFEACLDDRASVRGQSHSDKEEAVA